MEATSDLWQLTSNHVCCRVIVLACKQLDSGMGPAQLRHLPRTQAESGLTFAGFAVLACPLKPG